MSALRKGWCPGALRPMPAKDGLLVRLKITCGILPAGTARTLAALSDRYGNGLFDLSSRGNLQMRGVRGETLQALQDGLSTLGLVDADANGEAVRNVIASPLAGLNGSRDIRPLTRALERRLTQDSALHALPAKFGFLIDDASEPSLASVPADVRFDWTSDEFSIGLGGTRKNALRVAQCSAEELVERGARIGRAAVALFERHPDLRRMRDLIAEVGADPVLAACYEHSHPTRLRRATPDQVRGKLFFRTQGKERARWLWAPFGRLDANMLRAAAAAAETTPHGELRLTPWRAILIPKASHSDVPGFITDPAEPRLRVAACVGIDGCDRGSTNTRDDALQLASVFDASTTNDIALHVSGCEKGCAKASPTPVTLVARNGRYDLVRDGRASDTPARRGLSLDKVRKMLAAELEPA